MKRKRKSSTGSSEKSQTPHPRYNPFLFLHPDQVTAPGNDAEDGVLHHVLVFLERKNNGTTTGDDKLYRTVEVLLSFLEKGEKERRKLDVDDGATVNHGEECLDERHDSSPTELPSRTSLVSELDVAGLLLPWATKHLLQLALYAQKNREPQTNRIEALYWRSIASCLETLIPKENKSGSDADAPTRLGDVTAVLTQSALNKLVPFAAHVALSSNDKEMKELRAASASCYVLLTDLLYRPTMDLACNMLLVALVNEIRAIPATRTLYDPASITLPSQEHVRVVISTIRLLRMLQRQRVASPKKVFLLLSSPPVLSSLSCVYFLRSTQDDGDFILDSQNIIRELLWDGFFSPSDHIDGFRTMKMPVPTPTGQGKTDDASTQVEKTKTEGVTEKETGDKISHCYQENLICTMQKLLGNSPGMFKFSSQTWQDGTNANSESTLHEEEMIVTATAMMAPVLLDGFISQTSAWDRDHRGKASSYLRQKKHRGSDTVSGSTEDISAVQFRFWSNIAWPMVLQQCRSVRLNDSRQRDDPSATEGPHMWPTTNLVFLSSLRECLSLILKQDTYLPSYEDKDNRSFLFLAWLTAAVLDLTEEQNNRNSHSLVWIEEKNEILRILEVLIRLNHVLLHDQLSRVFTFAGKCQSYVSTKESSLTSQRVSDLIATIMETYHKLRQLKHLFKSFLDAVDVIKGNYDIVDSNDSASHEASIQDAHALVQMNRIVHEPSIASALGFAIQHCPHGQLQSLFDVLNKWIIENTHHLVAKTSEKMDYPPLVSGYERCKVAESSLSVVADLFVLLIRNVRVDINSAPDVAHLCQESMATSALPLLVEHSSLDESKGHRSGHMFSNLMKQGLLLCGWLIDLQTRCDFWLSRYGTNTNDGSTFKTVSPDDAISLILDKALHAIVPSERSGATVTPGTSDRGTSFPPMLDELHFLACHRIQQLNSHIHEQHRIEASVHGAGERSSTLVAEAQRLVDFVMFVAGSGKEIHPVDSTTSNFQDGDNTSLDGKNGLCSSRWKILSEMIAAWSPYSKKCHIEAFLAWFFSSLSVADEGDAQSASSLKRSFPCGELVWQDVFEQDRNIALALLHDASFFEVEEISSQVRTVGAACAAEFVGLAVQEKVDLPGQQCLEGGFMFEGENLISRRKLLGSPLDSKRFSKLMNATEIIARRQGRYFDEHAVHIEPLRRALRILMILNGIPESSSETCSDSSICLDIMTRLEVLMQLLCLQHTPGRTELKLVAVQCICAIRVAASRELNRMPPKSVWGPLCDSACLHSLVFGFYRSTTELLEAMESEGSRFQEQLLLATGMFFEAVLAQCLSAYDHDTGPLLTFTVSFEAVLNAEHNTLSMRVVICLARSIVRRVLLSSQLPSGQTKVLFRLVKSMRNKLWNLIIAENSDQSAFENGFTLTEGGVFLGDTIRIMSMLENEGSNEEMSNSASIDVGNVCKEMLKVLHQSGHKDDSYKKKRAASYFLACVLASDSDLLQYGRSPVFFNSILQALQDRFVSSGGQSDHLLDAVFSKIVHRMDIGQVRELLHQLLRIPPTFDSEAIVCSVHMFQVVLMNVTGPGQRNEVSLVVRDFLFLALELLSPCSGAKKRGRMTNIEMGTSLLTCLMENKDIITMRERDIAVLLSHLSSVVGAGGSRLKPNDSQLEDHVYGLCCDLISSLIQRFPKQLYACAPSLICVLQALLRHALYGSLPEREVAERAAKFTRLCELLTSHRDVFKKHVLGLLLEFVDALKGDLGPTRKKGLLPAVYNLLDMLSQFETQQLNALMDTTGKALFRTVFQSYQKLHMYKGQY